jgi:hypothetical protein
MLLNFSQILNLYQELKPGNSYIFTFSHGRIFEYRSEDWVLSNLRDRMSNYGNIVSVRRPLFSDRYTIVVIPTTTATLYDWLEAFDSSWKDMGYYNYTFIQAEVGTVSTQPGGLEQVVPKTGEIVSKTVKEVISPFAPYIIILGGIYLLFKIGIPEYAKAKTKKYKRL